MKYNAVIKSHLLETLPENFKSADGAMVTIKEPKITITEFDRSVDPLSPEGFDKGFTVALTAMCEKHIFTKEGENRFGAQVVKELVGEYIVFSHDATLKAVIEGITDITNRLIKGANT